MLLGIMVGLFAAAADPPQQFGQFTKAVSAEVSNRLLRASQIRLEMLQSFCPPGAEILVWQIRPEADEVRFAFAQGDSSDMSYSTSWESVSLIVDRLSLPGYLLAQATEPIRVPPRGAGTLAWNRWMADSRVEVRMIDRALVHSLGWIPRSDRRNVPMESLKRSGRMNQAPVAPGSSR